MNTQQQDDDHIIMFPFMAQGHIIPFLALAKLISQRKPNTRITLVSTPLNIKYLQLTLDSETKTIYKNISLAELPFSGTDHGLPPNSENTDSLPSHLIESLFYASETLKPSFDNLITQIITNEKRVPACIISDIFLGWVNDIAERVGAYHISFTTGGGYGTAVYFSMWMYLPHRKNDDDRNDLIEEFHVPEFPDTCRLHISQLPVYLREADKETPFAKFFQKQISLSLKSDGMLCNTVEEIEVLGLETLRKHMDCKPVWTIGPLLPPFLLGNGRDSTNKGVASNLRAGKEFGISPESCIEWLNHKKPSSVLYISFGSQNTIRASKMMELALGLEKSGKCFIWVLRPPSEFDIKSEFRSEWLPQGFVERIKESQRGLLVKKWAPQLEILCHKSTGAFLSHCGWNSVLESLSQGVPIIGWPLAAEQCYNSKMMEEEMGVCMELARVDGQVANEDVKKIIEQVMDSSKGDEMRKKAMVIGEKIRASMTEDKGEGDCQKGSSIRSVDDFLATVTSKN
ncbi:UDP-glycosyltransferase 92A1-like [Papaver somniferum]|uniref:UDP-glycosyltransferase 92A1-like n=1 Tax=Papaver somniferum TaxID=3469 RepID=UPI000E7012AD|nr:UDP-glycosyltransferase 92A1-like [Papaver somniferum]